MKPPKALFVCQECGGQSPKWMGRCAECGAWNSLVEERVPDAPSPARRRRRPPVHAARRSPAARSCMPTSSTPTRHASGTGIGELDRVLGGGIVPGSLVLLGGEPGIGKSTLLLQAAANVARDIGPVLYSSGEESEHQVKSRGERLGVGRAPLVPARRNLPREDPRRGGPPQAGARRRRLHPDGVLAEAAVGARQHRAGA